MPAQRRQQLLGRKDYGVLGIEVGGIVTIALLLTAIGLRAMSRTDPRRTFLFGWRRMTYGEWKRRRFIPGLAVSLLFVVIGIVVALR